MVWEKEKMMLQRETAEKEAEIKKEADERQLNILKAKAELSGKETAEVDESTGVSSVTWTGSPSLICKNYICKLFVKTVEPTSLKFRMIIELITLHLEYTIAQVKYAKFSYAHAQIFVLLNGEWQQFLLASES